MKRKTSINISLIVKSSWQACKLIYSNIQFVLNLHLTYSHKITYLYLKIHYIIISQYIFLSRRQRKKIPFILGVSGVNPCGLLGRLYLLFLFFSCGFLVMD